MGPSQGGPHRERRAVHSSQYDPRGLLTRSVRDASGFAFTTTHEYDDAGLPTVTRFLGPTPADTVTVTETHRELLERWHSVSGPGLDAPLTTRFDLDPDRLVKTITHPGGSTETFLRDPAGRVLSSTRSGGPFSITVHRGFDRNGNLLWQSDPREPSWKTEFLYDGHLRLARERHPLDSVSSLLIDRQYWPGGLLRSEARSGSSLDPLTGQERLTLLHRSSYDYDELGFLTRIVEGPEPEVSRTFGVLAASWEDFSIAAA